MLVVVVTSDWSDEDDVRDEELLDDVICYILFEREREERRLFCLVFGDVRDVFIDCT